MVGSHKEEAKVETAPNPWRQAQGEADELPVRGKRKAVVGSGHLHALEKFAEGAEKIVDAHRIARSFAFCLDYQTLVAAFGGDVDTSLMAEAHVCAPSLRFEDVAEHRLTVSSETMSSPG